MKKLGWLSMCLFLLLFKPAFTQVATETETEMIARIKKNNPNLTVSEEQE